MQERKKQKKTPALRDVLKRIIFFFRQTLCQDVKNINQYSRRSCRALNASLSSFAFQSPGFRRNPHSASAADCPPPSCLTDEADLGAEDMLKAVLPEGILKKEKGWVGVCLPRTKCQIICSFQVSMRAYKSSFLHSWFQKISSFGPFPLGSNHLFFTREPDGPKLWFKLR